MSEEADIPEAGESNTGVDPTATAMALAGASREDARAFLKQGALIEDQRHHLREQFKRLKMGVISDRLTIGLKLLTGVAGLAVAACVALMVWYAAHSDGLIVESFSVPPDMAARGLTGEAIASQLLDKLVAVQNATNTGTMAKSSANNWGDDLKVEIPETGVSLGEAYRFLCGWLGHETHIRGELYRTANGIAINARINNDGGQRFSGAESDLDSLVQQTAEFIYRTTQPYRYTRYLVPSGRPEDGLPHVEEARAILTRLTNDPSPVQRHYAWNSLAIIAGTYDRDTVAAEDLYRKSLTFGPYGTAEGNLAILEARLGHAETALAADRIAEQRTAPGKDDTLYPEYVAPAHLSYGAWVAAMLGDYSTAAELLQAAMDLPGLTPHNPIDPKSYVNQLVRALAGQHDGRSANVMWKQRRPTSVPSAVLNQTVIRIQIDAALGNWQAVADATPAAEKAVAASTVVFDASVTNGRVLGPLLAQAKAMLGDVAGAQALIEGAPADCYPCLSIRGQIAAAAKQWGRADYWFARAVQQAPSIPFAYADWGAALLARGDAAGAIEKFKLSSQKGPHFADPLEGWGEALMAQNRSDLALAKFTEADKYAPNWGRLHLKWGEALAYAGKKTDAQKQFAVAAALDLTPAEKTELARVNAHG